MHFKKIIIDGFKSFADKITITLDTGITGVVGPNGSGKSNVIDAVRWVMGEQNAKNLRGEKATDIIFAGSERRKALGMAEVSLVFDNTDDSAFCPPEYRHEPEITLTRRIYADGEREYLINRRPCRFKDIIFFFASTGLGGRSYSMIQQGQVDRILNAKPEDIREILEEAAGTSVYKKRKLEAQKKLEDTHLNLSRIDDILTEVQGQLTSLEGQVERAKEFNELSERLRQEELSLLAHNFRHFNAERNRIQSLLDESRANEASVLADIATFEASRVDLQSRIDDADPEIQALQEKVAVVREHIARAESTIKSATEKLDSGAKRLAAVIAELAEDDDNLKDLERQVETARTSVSQADTAATALRATIDSFDDEVAAADEATTVFRSRMDDVQDEIRNLERLVEANKFRTETTERDLSKLAAETAEQEGRQTQLVAEDAVAQAELAEADTRAKQVQDGLDLEIKEKHRRETAMAQRYQEAKDASAHRDKLKERYHDVRARYTSLAELDAGATDVAESVHKLRQSDPQTLAAMAADLLAFKPAAKELPTTTIGALEKWSERVVAEDFDEFLNLARLAARNGIASLPVIVLSHCETVDGNAARSWASRFGAESMTQYLAVDSTRAGSKAGAVERLMNRLYFLPALAPDEEAVSSLPRGILAFTSQGVLLSSSGDLHIGGKATGGLLSRKVEMEALAEELKEVEGKLGKTQARLDELGLQVDEDRHVIAEIDAELLRQNKDVLAVMQALQNSQQLADRIREMLHGAAAQRTKLAEGTAKLETEHRCLQESRVSLLNELQETKQTAVELGEEEEELQAKREELRRTHESRRLELAKLEARAATLRDGFATTKAQLELLQNKLTRRYEERVRLEQDLAQAKLDYEGAGDTIAGCLAERERLTAEYSEKREASAGVLEEIRVLDGRLKDLRDRHGGMQRSLAEANVDLERLRMALIGVKEQALEKYKLDIAMHVFEANPNFDSDAQGRVVTRLRNRVEGMGAINMMALEEYQDKSARRDFIAKQKDEVIAAIGLLGDAIAEIEETSLAKFLTTFEKVNEEFGGLFPILFPGGEGKLELTSPDVLLESGIEIMCRLPGKSKKPMTLFSGGEKALTAISLILALLKTKPTPYCFLDEVDAPLDEANVGRFNRVLEALSDQFQFIVITHNRRTMEILDTLYGVTMQEPGVSKIVGVDMQKDLPPHLRKALKDEKIAASPPPAVVTSRMIEGATSR